MEVRERIIEVAGKMFFREGTRRITMDAIARRLGISKRTIYEVFKDKTELLKAVVDTVIAQIEEDSENMKKQASDSMELIMLVIEYGINAIREINPVYFEDVETRYPKLWNDTLMRKRERVLTDFQDFLSKGIEEGYFRKDLHVPLVARIFMEQMNVMHRKNIFPSGEFAADEIFEMLFLNFIRGISTSAGIKKLEELSKIKQNN